MLQEDHLAFRKFGIASIGFLKDSYVLRRSFMLLNGVFFLLRKLVCFPFVFGRVVGFLNPAHDSIKKLICFPK